MSIYVIKASIKISLNIENYGKYLRKIHLERKRKRRRKMAKRNELFYYYLYFNLKFRKLIHIIL